MVRGLWMGLVAWSGLGLWPLAGGQEPEVPRVWNDADLAGLELSIYGLETPIRHLSEQEYYRLPVRPIYRSYTVYHPDHEPAGYRDHLATLEPEIVFDAGELETRHMELEEIFATHEAIPPGVFARHGDSPFFPARVPSLVGIADRGYLDASGLVKHRDVGDLMRYIALTQGMAFHSQYGDWSPDPTGQFGTTERYGDPQLRALAMFLYSLESPENPNPEPVEHQKRGREVFAAEGCAKCHTPPLYSNNKLVMAPGVRVAKDHPARADIMNQRVGTNPDLTTKTRRGTGFCKVPSLIGLWYRGPFGHSGEVSTLEDWFDPARLEDDYRPNWSPPGVTHRAVPGHEFGLDLSPEDKAALIGFLRSL